MGKFMLVDGNSLVHRAFHALPLLQNSTGQYTNAVYGFVMMFQRAMKDLNPSYGAVAFDISKKTFRNEFYDQYKATRKATAEELKGQFVFVKEVIRAFGFPVLEAEGYEADDIIGTLSLKAAQEGHDVYIVTGDRDAFQLISSNVSVLLTRKGISETDLLDENALYEKYGLTPKQIIDLKGLMGDSSDNIPGIPGVGEKTALKLLLEFGTIDNLYENLDKIKGKLQEKLKENKELAYVSKKLATIDLNVNLGKNVEDCKLSGPDNTVLKNIYGNLGFKSLLKELPENENMEPLNNIISITSIQVDNEDKLKEVIFKETPTTYITYERASLESLPTNIYFAFQEEVYKLPYADINSNQRNLLANYLASDRTKIFHDLKAAHLLLENAGFIINGVCHDITLMAYLLNPGNGKYTPSDIAVDVLQTSLEQNNEDLEAAILDKAYPILIAKLKATELYELYQNIELPLVTILANMEQRGIVLDVEELQNLGDFLTEDINKLTSEIYELAGEEFNINSPKQMGVILFEKLNLPIIKKTKTGYSTGAEILEELADLHDIVAKILDYRTLAKIKNTYIEGLQNVRNIKTGRLHTSFNQTITSTGRLSSTEPNLQNIPIRVEVGRQIRKAFKASPGHLLLAADYSQIELRILAHLSADENFVDAFMKEQDIHTRTACEVFGVDEDEVTPEMRRRAKAVNFGIVYGISDFGLSKDLRIPRKEAKTYINNYFDRYKGVKNYLDQTIENARKDGYVVTIFKRRRYLPDLFSSNRNVRNFGERTAMNTPIQGSAADIIKLAMIKVEAALQEKGLKTQMLLQVHDELIFEVPENELTEVAQLVKTAMENACKLRVPLIADLKVGKNWYDMMQYSGGEI